MVSPLLSIFHAAVALFPITVYDENTRKAHVTSTQQLLSDKESGSDPVVEMSQSPFQLCISSKMWIKYTYSHHHNTNLAFSLQLDECVAVHKTLKWTTHLYGGFTYL